MTTSTDLPSSMGEGCATAPFATSPRSLSLLLLLTWTSFLFERRLVANALPILPRPKTPTRAISNKPHCCTTSVEKIKQIRYLEEQPSCAHSSDCSKNVRAFSVAGIRKKSRGFRSDCRLGLCHSDRTSIGSDGSSLRSGTGLAKL